MSIVELFVICSCALGIITLIVIAIYQHCHYKHNIVDMSDSIRIMQSIINKVKCGDVKCSQRMSVTIEELQNKMFRPVFIEGRCLKGEVTYESAKEYMSLLIQDAKDKMQELYPNIKFKIAFLDQKSTQQFFVICTFLIDGKLFYLFDNFSWNLDASKEFLEVTKVTQVDNG